MSKKPMLLIDGSAFIFLHGNKENFQETVMTHIRTLLDYYQTDSYVFMLEVSGSNFRRKVAYTQAYKGNREKQKEKLAEYQPFLPLVKQFVYDNLQPVTYVGIENDDALQLAAIEYAKSDEYYPVIVGVDSDLLCIEGEHYRMRNNTTMIVSLPGIIELVNKNGKDELLATGIYATYSKVLKGAAKEHYKGLPGYGVKKVYSLLKDLNTEDEMKELCIECFIKEFGYIEGMKKLDEGFRLCYLLRENVNFVLPKPVQFKFNKDEKKEKKFVLKLND